MRQCTNCNQDVTRGARGSACLGPDGPASMCNRCYKRWVKQGRPPEWSDTRPSMTCSKLAPEGRVRQCTNCNQALLHKGPARNANPGPEGPASMCKRCYDRWAKQGRPAEWGDTRPSMTCSKLMPAEHVRQCTNCKKYVGRKANPGPEGPASMCNRCYKRWARQGRPAEWGDTLSPRNTGKRKRLTSEERTRQVTNCNKLGVACGRDGNARRQSRPAEWNDTATRLCAAPELGARSQDSGGDAELEIEGGGGSCRQYLCLL